MADGADLKWKPAGDDDFECLDMDAIIKMVFPNGAAKITSTAEDGIDAEAPPYDPGMHK